MGDDISDALDVCGRDHASPFVDIGDDADLEFGGTRRSMVEVLRRKGRAVGYFLFSGEQHGFRKADTIKRCLDTDLAFYAIEVFKIGLRFQGIGTLTRFTTCLCLAPGTLQREVSRSRRVISARTRWFPQDPQNLAVRRERVSYLHRLHPPWI
jgi:hypothetical protein